MIDNGEVLLPLSYSLDFSRTRRFLNVRVINFTKPLFFVFTPESGSGAPFTFQTSIAFTSSCSRPLFIPRTNS